LTAAQRIAVLLIGLMFLAIGVLACMQAMISPNNYLNSAALSLVLNSGSFLWGLLVILFGLLICRNAWEAPRSEIRQHRSDDKYAA